MRKKDYITWSAGMYNFDDTIFPDPMKVDFDRKRSAHMSLGSGIHFCVGAFLARMELEVFIRTWLERIPEFQVADGADVRYRIGINMDYEELPPPWDVWAGPVSLRRSEERLVG